MKIEKWFTLLFNIFTSSNYRVPHFARIGLYDMMDDENYLKKIFRVIMHQELDLENPRTFNQKLQWLKLHDRCPQYSIYVDKFKVRDYIMQSIGDKYLVPLLGVWDKPDEINFELLPEQFVLKCNHNSGTGMCICTNKSDLNLHKVTSELKKGIKQNFYLSGREWPYKNVQRKIVCEKYITDNPESNNLTDYKFFCFNGYVDCVMVCLDRTSGDTKFYFFDKQWNLKRINLRGKSAPDGFTIPKPISMDEMFGLASKLSVGMPFVRVDFYQSNDKVYFGELTLFPQSGFDANLLPETDLYFGNLIDLNLAYGKNK